jgi:hypothetical protein
MRAGIYPLQMLLLTDSGWVNWSSDFRNVFRLPEVPTTSK